MLALARFIPMADASLRRGEWAKEKFLGMELSGKTLGIVGVGRIGSAVAERARALGMRVLAFDPYVARDRAEQFGALRMDSLDDLLAQSDFVSIHTPLEQGTRGLIGAAQMEMLKPGARLICCARGGVVDERALFAALEQKKIAGAALDVFENEPLRDSPLMQHPHVILTPHIGAMTQEAQIRAAIDVAEQVVGILAKD
jgi:D-3-phosphoglycerate dehydrogenase